MIFKTAILGLLVAIVGVLLVPGRADVLVTSGPVQPLNPYRVLDTRETFIAEPGSVTPVNTRLPGGATAASVNITVTDVQTPGYLTAWDGRSPMPVASIINAAPGDTIANFAIVPINSDGTFHLYSSMRTNIVVDVMGFVAGPDYGWTQPFTYAQGAFLTIGDRGWQVFDGRASMTAARSLIDSCQGATLFYGDFPEVAYIAAHRTSCGSLGFGGVESMNYGDRITMTINGVNKTYELFWKMDGVPLHNEGKPVPLGTSVVLQTSQTANTVYFRFFRLV